MTLFTPLNAARLKAKFLTGERELRQSEVWTMEVRSAILVNPFWG